MFFLRGAAARVGRVGAAVALGGIATIGADVVGRGLCGTDGSKAERKRDEKLGQLAAVGIEQGHQGQTP
ncbi:hypothetical protein [Lysobacter solisilvae (ex Woo and Kim 2020)]|uniref:Uncharacterized protein n=1 Tax=Agrilutibacter terrestris TaxID=2865112 RepID=A0A7H0FXC6_9GAMM|nr:hypothetical protein [Lysobacter terrestris]QNP40692.1 hypothetical protein H8B22_00005 [Lysobacter terrestris]